MLINMIHDNHGEPRFKTRYRDPEVLAGYGYGAIVIPEALGAIPAAYESSGRITGLKGAPTSLKPEELEAQIDEQVQSALAVGMQVFFYDDALLLPRNVVMRRPADFLCDDPTGRLCPAKPAVWEALKDLVGELFDRWPRAAGLVMRTGEVYPEATPHMLGNPLHASNCPACRGISPQDRLVRFITEMHAVVIGEQGKIYVHRAWQPGAVGRGGASGGNMHDDPEVYRAIAGRVPASDRLHFSFKFTRGDFQAGQPFNPCLLADERPKWIEFQCEREFEGKGAFPNYQGPLWQEFLRQLRGGGTAGERFHLWGWSRGGGWGGPYVQREEWIDANVHALAKLSEDANVSVADVATSWVAGMFQVAESSPPAPAITELLLMSAGVIQKLLRAVDGVDPESMPWVHDDLLDVSAVWTAAGSAIDAGKAQEAVEQKMEALRGVDRIRQLFELAAPELPNRSQARDLGNSLAYFSSFAGTVAHLFVGFVRFAHWARSGRTDAAVAKLAADSLRRAQAEWQQHTQRHALLPGAPSVFRENTLWQRTNDCLEQLGEA